MKLTLCPVAAVLAVALAAGAAHADDPTTADCLGASENSLKLGNEQKLRAERAQLLVCAAATCPADIRKECLRHVDEVNAQIPTIIFAVKDTAGNDLSAVKVTMDGEVLAERLQGVGLSMDPGEHTFTFEAPGQGVVTKKLIIAAGQKDRREQINFGAATTTTTTDVPVSPSSGGLGTQKKIALVTGGLGIVGVGLGTVFGLIAMGKKSDAQNECPNQCTTPDGVSKWNDAATAGNVSTVAFIVGGVALAGAAVLWFTAPRGKTQVGLGPQGVQVKGVW